MSVTAEKTVREVAVTMPGATRVFEKLGIDYCCGGNRTLEEACQAAHVSLDHVQESLAAAGESANELRDDRHWQAKPLADLIDHIENAHHKYVRDACTRLGPLFDKVCSVHGKNHPELRLLRDMFDGLAHELATHLMKEEMVLFPYIARMEEAVTEKSRVIPPPFGTVRNPVAIMIHEHDDAGTVLQQLRQTSNAFTAPPDACASYRTLYQALADFEADLHQHIHLENNLLFPRAIEMETAGR